MDVNVENETTTHSTPANNLSAIFDVTPPNSDQKPLKASESSTAGANSDEQVSPQRPQELLQEENEDEEKHSNRSSTALKNVLLGPKDADTHMSTLSKQQQSWLDPDEAAVQDSFYRKDFHTLRPTFNNVEMAIRGVDEMKDQTQLNQLFMQNDSDVQILANSFNNTTDIDDQELEEAEQAKAMDHKKTLKFGVWDGVYARCLLNIFGVIMFLRIGWMVGNAGVVQSIIIIVLSGAVTLLTTLSMSAICTNGQILGGGAYYIISRTLGPSIGGSVGVMFSIGNMIAVSLYLIGFAETLVENIGSAIFTGNTVNDVRIWSNIVLLFELILALLGLKYVIKVQMFLLAFIVVSILCFFIGSTYQTSDVLEGIDGWGNGNLDSNLGDVYEQKGASFFGVLAVFFPAMTGIMAGANISGDLKDPGRAIPLGTLTAVGTSVVIYCFMALVCGAVAARSELLSNNLVMADICVWEWLILIGIYAATLSSAIASLVGAPRILQAIADDNILPSLKPFAVVNKDGEPIRGYFLSFMVAAACNCIGELNFVAPIITLFFMIAYLMINFSCFALEISKSPGWRPSFTYFNKYTAFVGAATCLAFMFLIDWGYALASIVICIGVYFYIEWKDPIVNWGNVQSSRNFYSVYKALLKMRNDKRRITNVKNWRPSFLILTEDPLNKPQIVLFSQTLKKAYGPIFVGTVHHGDYRTNMTRFRESNFEGYLPRGFFQQKTNGFYEKVISKDLRMGVNILIQTCGIGTLRPNTLLLGYQESWQLKENAKIDEYIDVLRDAILMGMNIIICVGFKRINWHQTKYVPPPANPEKTLKTEFGGKYPESQIQNGYDESPLPFATTDTIRLKYDHDEIAHYQESNNFHNIYNNNNNNNIFHNNAKETVTAWQLGQGLFPIIDVWWLIDDGGLCMLLPYIMNLHYFWKRCRLRVNLILHNENMAGDVAIMETLIQKFRLPFEKPRVIIVEHNEPSQQTYDQFEKFSNGVKIDDLDRPSVMKKWLRLSEIMFEHSRYSGLIVVTLPLPAKKIPSKAYMALLECLTNQKRMPPMMVMRGNGVSTLTYYSE